MIRLTLTALAVSLLYSVSFAQYTHVPLIKPQCDAETAQFNGSVPDSIKQLFEDAVASVVTGGAADKALKADQLAPDVRIVKAPGDTIRLSQLLESGPIALVFYRGGWCPYSKIQLEALSMLDADVARLNSRFVAISPEIPDSAQSTKQKHGITFEVFSDLHNAVAKQFGVSHKVPSKVAKIYADHLKMHAYNGDTSNELPLSAAFVIDTDRTIKWASVNADFRTRAEPRDMLMELRKLHIARVRAGEATVAEPLSPVQKDTLPPAEPDTTKPTDATPQD